MIASLDLVVDADVGQRVRELYGGDLDGFVAARTALQRVARAAGRRDLAAAIGSLRKPTVAEHALNLLARSEDAALLGELRARHESATAAQAGAITGDAMARQDLRTATAAARVARAAVVTAASRRVGGKVGDARSAAVDAALQRLLDGGRWGELLAGMLGADDAGEPDTTEPVFRGVPLDATIPATSPAPGPAAGKARGRAAGRTPAAPRRPRGRDERGGEGGDEARAAREREQQLAAADAAVERAAAELGLATERLAGAAAALDAATVAHRDALRAARDAERAHVGAMRRRERLEGREPTGRRRT